MATINVTMRFQFGAIDNQTMDVSVNTGGYTAQILPDKNNIATVTVPVELPGQIDLKFLGKDPNDTLVSKSGEILADKFVQITSVELEHFPLNEIFIYQRLALNDHNGQTHVTNYVGFNGDMTIKFEHTNIFEQYLAFNS